MYYFVLELNSLKTTIHKDSFVIDMQMAALIKYQKDKINVILTCAIPTMPRSHIA